MKSFYEGKRVLVTGADGFMGSHLTERLLEMGAKVSVFVRGTSVIGTSKTDLRNINHVKDKIEQIIAGDISSTDTINLIRNNNPEIIFHLAAEAYVPKSFEQPLEVVRTNALGTLHVLEAARLLKNIQRIVCTSSSEIYGPYPDPIKEDFHPNPTSPYGASKLAADRYAYSYFITFGLPIAIIRPFNTYGPRHTYDVIPKFIDLALKGEPLTIYGDGSQTRDFTYVDDTVNGFLLMGYKEEAIGKAINFGTGSDTTVKEIAEKIKEISESSSEIIYIEKRKSEVTRLCSDPSKAKELLGWEPKVSLSEGLRRNIDWEKGNR